MKLKIFNVQNKETGTIELPKQFDEPVRDDLIKRAVMVVDSNNIQPYGADPMAGKKHSTWISRRRRNYRGSYGHGISRVPRKVMSRRGRRLNWVAAFAPGTRGGRRAHPPKGDKINSEKINIKERRKAIRSALSAVILKDTVIRRGHFPPDNYPFALESKFEDIKKTADLRKALMAMGMEKELIRTSEVKVRAGKGKARGRKYKRKTGLLIVVADDCSLMKAGTNIPGIDIVEVKSINAKLLAPGSVPGRLTLFSEKAINAIREERLFI